MLGVDYVKQNHDSLKVVYGGLEMGNIPKSRNKNEYQAKRVPPKPTRASRIQYTVDPCGIFDGGRHKQMEYPNYSCYL